MSMNRMPDDCLLHIFKLIHDTHTLFKCLRVSRRWNRLVNYRLARTERLLDKSVIKGTELCDKSLCYDVTFKPLVQQILSKIIKKSPKLKVVSVGYEHEKYKGPRWLQRSVECLFKLESLEGLLLSSTSTEEIDVIPQSVKYLFCYDTIIKKGYYPRVKHLVVEDDMFYDSIHRFPNVEWLYLRVVTNPYEWFEVAYKNQHPFRKLKVLEIDTTWEEEEPAEENLAVRFIDICPQLESAHLRISIDQWVPNDNFRHKNLTNLVITFKQLEQLQGSLSNLRILLKRFPNIKHLAIKYMCKLSDTDSFDSNEPAANESEFDYMLHMLVLQSESNNMENYESGFDDDDDDDDEPSHPRLKKICRLLPMLIIHQLKKLVLLDMRNIIGVDESSNRCVESICKLHKRSVKFYYGNTEDGEIERDWPELFDKHRDTSAFKFMANHFLRDFRDLRDSVVPDLVSDV